LIPKNKKQLAVMLYNQTVGELQNDPDMWLEFLKFSAKIHKYAFRDQVLLFAHNPSMELVADFDQWNNIYGRRIKSREKSISIFDPKNNRIKGVFDVSQTWGNDFKVFDWDLGKQDKENLLEHWHEVAKDIPNFDTFASLDFKLQLVIDRVLNAKVSDTRILNCAEYVMMERMGMQVTSVDEEMVRTALTGNNFDELMTSIHQPAKEVLLEIEQTLEKNYGKERVSYNERITTSITEPTLPRKPDWAAVSSRRHSVQSPTGGAGGSLEPTRSDRSNVPDETGGGESRNSGTTEVRGEVLPRSEAKRNRGTRENRQSLREVTGTDTSTRDGDRANSALPDASPTSQGDNSSGIQIDNEKESVAENVADFSFGSNSETRQQLSLFGEPKAVETINPVSQSEIEPVTNENYYTQEIIDDELVRGSGTEGGKGRIYYLFLHENDKKKRIKFLKEEYGWYSHSSSSSLEHSVSYSGKGLQLYRYEIDELNISWSKVEKRIGELVATNQYMSADDLQKFQVLYADAVGVSPRYEPFMSHEDILLNGERILVTNGLQENSLNIDDLNPRFGNNFTRSDYEAIEKLKSALHADEQLLQSFKVNTEENFRFTFADRLVEMIVEQFESNTEFLAKVLEDKPFQEFLTNEIIDEMNSNADAQETITDAEQDEEPLNIDPSEIIEIEDDTPLSLFDFDEDNITTVIHELVEIEDTPILEAQVETTPVIEVESEDDFPVEVIEIIDTIEVNEVEPISNFKFPEGDFYATTKRAKFRNNIDAILLLKKLESTGRAIDESDHSTLAHYVGWGGLSEAFDSKNQEWKNEYEELQELLTPDEYKAALDSVLTAYYTDPRLVAEIYHATEQFGIKPKTILDPAMGTGNFFSRLPEHLEDAKLYGVELDSITGRIAQKLYPDATVAVKGYEAMPFQDNTFDLVVGNIPFGDVAINDDRYGKQKFLIHDYFIAKSIDVVKPDGMVAFVTSKGTLDKKDDQIRRYLAERADLVCAVRLPSNAFTAIAGTSVTSDVLFFQKRAELRDLTADMPSWVQTQPFQNSQTTINQYFLDNPDHVLGELAFSSIYGPQSALVCKPRENQDLYKDFRQALIGEAPDDLDALFKELQAADDLEEIMPEGTRNNTYFVHQDKLYYKTVRGVEEMTLPQKTTQRLKAMCTVKHHLMEVINTQLEVDYDTNAFQKSLIELNHSYDDFVKKHGYFNDKTNRTTFATDDQLPLLLSIEKKSKEDKSISKGDIFFKPTIRPIENITHVETAHDALIVSLSKKLKVDLDFMTTVSDFSKDELIKELDGMIFQDPTSFEDAYSGWLHRDEYLSGDVKEKLVEAIEADANNPKIDFSKNINALEGVMPEPLKASEIEFQLGSTWIPMSVYQDFMHETFETAFYNKKTITIEHCKYANRWHINSKNNESGNIKVSSTYGTGRINAYEILEKTLNLGQINIKDKIKDPDGSETWVLNVEQTMIARAKQDQIKQRFSTWLFEEPKRASFLIDIYNERFNRFVPRNYDGSHLEFPNLSTSWKLRSHQENVAARILYNRSALMAHEVGAGKTASMIVAGMSLKQLGAIHKPLYVVPSHLTEQFASEFLSMYPTANVLMTTKRDFEKKNRHQFVSKIATNDYDAVIIGHSQFEKIPLSPEREEQFLQSQLDEIIDSLENTTADEKSWSVKSMVRFKLKLEDKLSDLRNQERKDNVINFEQLGVDFMFVDEAHVYKNLLTVTKLENVAGISNSSSQRAMDMFMKCRYVQEANNGGGVVFATGTPISNSMSELYIMMRFLQNDVLKSMGLASFDDWASTFGEITSSLEMTPEGRGYRIRNRFAKFHNLPELMSMFQLVADIQTHDMLNLPTPDLHGGKAQIVISEPSPYQQDMMADLADRAEHIRTGNVDPSVDNMLKITHEAKLMAIDPRLLNPIAPVDEGSKLFQCANNVYKIWEDTAEHKLTQIIFSDSGTPKKDQFNVYHEIKDQLMKKGIPEAEIAFIHDAKTDTQREQLFDKVRSGEVRVILGSTGKIGTGTNIQDKLIAGHHVDCPWRPADLVQRDGRVVRQGNENDVVFMFRYVTKGTFDSYLWQIQEQKLKYISQVMTGKSISRSCSDLDETVLSAAEVKAIATSNPLLAEKMNLDNEVARLQLVKNSWANERISLQEKIQTQYPNNIIKLEKDIETRKTEIATLNTVPVLNDEKGKGIFSIKLNGQTYDSRTEAFETMTDLVSSKRLPRNKRVAIGEYRGLTLSAEVDNLIETRIYINGRYGTDFTALSGVGNLTRLQNKVNDLPKDLEQKKLELADSQKNLEMAKLEITKPFEQEAKLSELLNKQSEINRKIEFGVTDDKPTTETNDGVNEEFATGENEFISSNDSGYVEVEEDQFIPDHLAELEDIPAKEMNRQAYQELA